MPGDYGFMGTALPVGGMGAFEQYAVQSQQAEPIQQHPQQQKVANAPQQPTLQSKARKPEEDENGDDLYIGIDSAGQGGNTFRLPGDMGEFLGDLERFELAITLEGDQGSGKSRFSYQLVDAFADMGLESAYFTLEIGRSSDLVKRMRDEYIKPANRAKVKIADRLPAGLKTLHQAAENFDVVIVDSWTVTKIEPSEVNELRKAHPDTIFVFIFQRTTGKTIRGGTQPLFDCGINIDTVKEEDFKNNYAICRKNRYGMTGVRYNVFSQSIAGEEEAENKSPAPVAVGIGDQWNGLNLII